MQIRQTTPADYAAVYDLIQTAFQTALHRDGTEQDFAVRLRESEKHIPSLDLLALIDRRPAGHIMFTRTYLTRPDGSRYDTLLVAPLSVVLEHRGMGVGAALIQEGLCRAASMGYGAAFLLGDPGYYGRLGFQLAEKHAISHAEFPAKYVQVRELHPGALKGITGIIAM